MKETPRGQSGEGKRWRAAYDPKFERQRLGLGKNIVDRVNQAVDDLLMSENVMDPRDSKGRIRVDGVPTHVFACRVGRSYRIPYCVSGDCIRFLRVGDHKAVYGKG